MMLQPYAPNQLDFLFQVHCQLRHDMKEYGDLDPFTWSCSAPGSPRRVMTWAGRSRRATTASWS